MKYSLRKSFSNHRRTEVHDDDHTYPRLDANGCSSSNSNLVKTNKKTKSFLRRRRRFSSSSSPQPPPPASAPPISNRTKSKTCETRYSNHINDDDDDDEPFSPSTTTNSRVRPLDRLTHQLRKSFRNTLTRQRSRLESTNSNKGLILHTNDPNPPINQIISPISMGLSSQVILPTELISTEPDKVKASAKRRKAPLAPSHISQSISAPNPECSTLNINDNPESGYVSSSNEQEKNSLVKKTKFNQSFRTRISLLLKKRHEKRQQMHSSLDEESDQQQQHHDDHHLEEFDTKKVTFSQRFDTIRRSFHLGKRNTTSKGKGHLLLNE